MSDLVFYTNPMSRGRIVRWMLEEIGAPYDTRVLDYGPQMKSPEYLAINPMGKVPAITHRGVVVTECAAILAYLADAFPQAGLAPAPDDALRGTYYRWLFFAAGPLEAAATNTALGLVPPPERKGMVGYGDLSDVLSTLEHAIGDRPYLAGDRFSAADLYVGAHLNWGMMFGTLPKTAVFERYVANLTAREAAVRANAIDDSLPQPKLPAG